MTSLLEIFNAFPGGVGALAEAVDTSPDTLYRVAKGAHAKKPVRVLCACVSAFPRKVLGEKMSYAVLEAKWLEAQGAA